MPPPIHHTGRHAWLAVREGATGAWTRWECCSPHASTTSTPLDAHGYDGDVRLHAVWRGARVAEFSACIERETARYEHSNTYRVVPGPNSNTYIDAMLRRCGLHATLPATAVGRDFRGWFGVTATSGGTGVQLETPIIGLRIGLTEGVEVHVFGLAFGIDLWPPAIILPVGPGRLGFDDL